MEVTKAATSLDVQGLVAGSVEWWILKAISLEACSNFQEFQEMVKSKTLVLPSVYSGFIALMEMLFQKQVGKWLFKSPVATGRLSVVRGILSHCIVSGIPFVYTSPDVKSCQKFIRSLHSLREFRSKPNLTENQYHEFVYNSTTAIGCSMGSELPRRVSKELLRPIMVLPQKNFFDIKNHLIEEAERITKGVIVIEGAHVFPSTSESIAKFGGEMGWSVVALTSQTPREWKAGIFKNIEQSKVTMREHQDQALNDGKVVRLYKNMKYICYSIKVGDDLKKVLEEEKNGRALSGIMNNVTIMFATVMEVVSNLLPADEKYRRILIRVANLEVALRLEAKIKEHNAGEKDLRFKRIEALGSQCSTTPRQSSAESIISSFDSTDKEHSMILITTVDSGLREGFRFGRCCIDATAMKFDGVLAEEFMGQVAPMDKSRYPREAYVVSCPLLCNYEFMSDYVQEQWVSDNRVSERELSIRSEKSIELEVSKPIPFKTLQTIYSRAENDRRWTSVTHTTNVKYRNDIGSFFPLLPETSLPKQAPTTISPSSNIIVPSSPSKLAPKLTPNTDSSRILQRSLSKTVPKSLPKAVPKPATTTATTTATTPTTTKIATTTATTTKTATTTATKTATATTTTTTTTATATTTATTTTTAAAAIATTTAAATTATTTTCEKPSSPASTNFQPIVPKPVPLKMVPLCPITPKSTDNVDSPSTLLLERTESSTNVIEIEMGDKDEHENGNEEDRRDKRVKADDETNSSNSSDFDYESPKKKRKSEKIDLSTDED